LFLGEENLTDPNDGADPTIETHAPAGADYQSDRKFEDFPISDEMLRGILEHGYTTATPVQANTIEPALAGRDLIVRAKTGTGKTAAFSVPVLERLEAGSRVPQGVILAPTRELAQQIAEESEKLAKFKDVNVATLVGGLAIEPQVKLLKRGVELIVGTPGRILDHLRRGNLDLSEAHMLVLDEADEMLSMGFYEDVTKIIKRTRAERQVLLFSATISEETGRLVDEFLRDPEQIQLSTDADNVENIEHILYETDPTVHKIRSLLYVLDIENPTSAIIFCNTREDTATVASFLDRQGLDVQLLSGELSQARRSDVMTRVKAGNVRFLVSTDVASRGIDISDLSHVINYALPPDPPVYLHRTGRTGRIGKEGTAISLVGGTDLSTRKSLENKHGLKFDVRHLPNEEECVQQRVERQARQIREAMSTMVFEAYLPTVRALKERPGGDALLAAALRAFFQWDRSRRAEASGGGVSSVRALLDERSAKMERKGRGRKGSDSRGGPHRRDGRDRNRDGRDRNRDDKRPQQRDRGSSGSRPEKKKPSNDDLDAFLSLDD
jgi:ATP-dependent RNA helicase DeaD